MKKRIAVIGGGLAGTAAAYRLLACGYDVTVIERDDRLGGRIHSMPARDYPLEMGAGFITNAYDNLRAFLRDAGLDNQLTRQQGKTGIIRDNRIHLLGASTLMDSAVLSWAAKRQVFPLLSSLAYNWRFIDSHQPWRAASCDGRTVADIFRGAGGQEFLEYVIQPVLNGYFYWTPEQTGEAMLLTITKLLGGGRFKLRGGLQQIPERAIAGAVVLLQHTAQRAQINPKGGYRLSMRQPGGQTTTIIIDGIVCATTASAVVNIFPHLTEQQNDFFASVCYSKTAVLAQTYRHAATVGSVSIGFPRRESTGVAAVTISSESDHTSALKIYASGTAESLLAKTNRTLITSLLKEARVVRESFLGANARVVDSHLQRWPEALPVFDAGRFRRLQTFADGAIESPRQAIVFAGDYLGGPSMEGAFTSGLQAATRLHSRLQ